MTLYHFTAQQHLVSNSGDDPERRRVVERPIERREWGAITDMAAGDELRDPYRDDLQLARGVDA